MATEKLRHHYWPHRPLVFHEFEEGYHAHFGILYNKKYDFGGDETGAVYVFPHRILGSSLIVQLIARGKFRDEYHGMFQAIELEYCQFVDSYGSVMPWQEELRGLAEFKPLVKPEKKYMLPLEYACTTQIDHNKMLWVNGEPIGWAIGHSGSYFDGAVKLLNGSYGYMEFGVVREMGYEEITTYIWQTRTSSKFWARKAHWERWVELLGTGWKPVVFKCDKTGSHYGFARFPVVGQYSQIFETPDETSRRWGKRWPSPDYSLEIGWGETVPPGHGKELVTKIMPLYGARFTS